MSTVTDKLYELEKQCKVNKNTCWYIKFNEPNAYISTYLLVINTPAGFCDFK